MVRHDQAADLHPDPVFPEEEEMTGKVVSPEEDLKVDRLEPRKLILEETAEKNTVNRKIK